MRFRNYNWIESLQPDWDVTHLAFDGSVWAAIWGDGHFYRIYSGGGLGPPSN